MKKIILGLLLLLCSFTAFSQSFSNGFEEATFPPSTPGSWLVIDNGIGTVQSWAETNLAAQVNSGLKAAVIEREILPVGTTTQDWLVTQRFTVPANGQLRFFTRLGFIGNNGTTFEIKASTDALQSNQAAFTTNLATYTEPTLVATYNVYEEKIINFPAALIGQQVYVAFVRVFNRTTSAIQGDRWLIDDVKVQERCLDPTVLSVGTITPTTAVLSWINNGSATQWEIEAIPASSTPTGVGVPASTNPFTATGLLPGTQYVFYVRALCANNIQSAWVGPFNFLTKPAGSICSVPINITSLPYSTSSNINLYGDEVDTIQGTSCVAGATNYLQGDEVFYTYTPTATGLISISMTPTGNNSSLFVYNGCANFPSTCVAGVANTNGTIRVINNLAVTAGQTYVIVISSSSTTPVASIPYTLIIQNETCNKPAALAVSNIGTTTVDLSWSNPTAATAWEYAIQPVGSTIPSGAGLPANTNTNFQATGLTAATAYQYWVRSDCGGGIFSAWAGPFLFNTSICEASQRCNYTFRLTDLAAGWEGALMEVRQNGVVVATLGSTFITGTGPINITVPLCETLPFQLFWTTSGSFPGEVGISIINNFNQTLYTKNPGTGTASTTVPLYSGSFSCSVAACLPVTALTATNPTTFTATIGWTPDVGNATGPWSVYIVPTGTPAPTATTSPTFTGVTTNPFIATGLTQLTSYQVYVRNDCTVSSTTSAWTGPANVTTLPTCPKPINLNFSSPDLTQVTLGWTEAGTATQWEVFILPPGSPVPAPGAGVIVNGTPTYVATGLTPATNYIYYVRAICSPTDSSVISGPLPFRTAICAAVNQCNFRFTMRDQSSNTWSGNTISIFQNGILVTTLTGPANGVASVVQFVPLCTNLPFEVVWNAGGTLPAEVSLSIANQLLVTLYNKNFGIGTQNSTLYTGLVECATLPCVKPTTLGANTITQNSANLTWVQPAPAPGVASGWQIVVQDATLGYPSGAGVTTGASPYPATSLIPGTVYEFYVRANCGSTDGFSNWSGPFKFTTKPGNDECASATNVIVNDDALCSNFVIGSLFGATGSLPVTTCPGTADDDIWFKFTATSVKHYINIFDEIGSVTDLNVVVYSGTCTSLVQQSCQVGNAENESILTGLTVGQTYYVRIYTATATPGQTVTFKLCIGTVSTCETAEATCSDPTNPFIFANTVGVASEGSQSCLGTNPNPTYYYMSILSPGQLIFEISQYTGFDANGNPIDPTPPGQLDVDFIAWGPFTSNTAACGNLTTANQVGCSYSASQIENFTINNAQVGQVYVFLITNFESLPGFIKFTQTNQTIPATPGVGATDCSLVCNVNLGNDQNVCGVSSVLLDSNLINPLATYKWYRNGVLIPSAIAQTYTATQSGTYKCVGTCGPNDVEDTVVVNIGPNVFVADQPDYKLCDDATNNGIEAFNLNTITPNVLLGLTTGFTYNVTYHNTESNALLGINTINLGSPLNSITRTIYIRVTCVESPQCNSVVPLNLVVKKLPLGTLTSSDADNTICSNETATLTYNPSNFVANTATYVWTRNGVAIPTAITNQYTPTATGTYGVVATLNGCSSSLSSLLFTINKVPEFTLTNSNPIKCINETSIISVVPVTTTFNIGDPTVSYTWKLDGVALPNTTSSITVTANGVYSVIVSNLGCSSISKQVTVTLDTADIAIAMAGECSGGKFIITATPVNGSYLANSVDYKWTNASGTVVGSNQNTFDATQYVIDNPGISLPAAFTVKVTTKPDGCTDTQEYIVQNASCIIQKGLSPNGDGDNDTFDLRGLDVKELTMFNRYGGKIFSQENYKNEWHGQNSKSENSPVGTYYYVIELRNGEIKTGWIYLNR
jgi:gliding motility-associated-like protein